MIRLLTGRLLRLIPSRLRLVVRSICLLAGLTVLAACEQGHDTSRIDVVGNQADMSLTPPEFLQTRNIERQNLVVEITIDGQTFEGTPDQNGEYVLQITRPVNSSTTVTVVWLEIIGDIRLPLARASKLLNVGSETSPASLSFASSEFDREQDDLDNDGYSNYTERQLDDGSSFADPDVPEFAPGIVNLSVELFLPQDLVGASEAIRAAVDAQATIKDIQVPLSREGDVWRGTMTVTENTTPLITVNFFDTAERAVTLAYKARSQEVGQGAVAIFLADAYETEQYNDDGDAFSNIVEIVNGTDPRDSSDPGAPVADAGADVTITAGASVTLNASGSSESNAAIVSYQWSEDGQVSGTGVSLVISGLTVGTHVIELLVTDSLGLTDTDTVTVTVEAAPVPNQAPVASAGADQTIASGESVTLNGSGSSDTDGTIASYQWTEGNVPRGSGVSPVVAGLSDGTHVITLLVTDDDGATDTDTVTIEVTPAPEPNLPPDADAGPDQTVDSGDSVTLDGSDSDDPDGTIASFQWSEGTRQLGSGVSLVINDLTDGTHVITLLVTDADGDTDTDTVTIEVTPPPAENLPPEADAGPDQTIDSGDSVTLDGSGSSDMDGNINSYIWTEGPDLRATGVSPVVTGLDDGTHVITLLVTDNEGDTDTDTVTIVVTPPPVQNRPPEADAGIDQEITAGESVTLDGGGSDDPDGSIVSYKWTEGGEELGTSADPTLLVSGLAEGSYTFTLLVTDNEGDTDTDMVKVDVIPAPVQNQPPMADAGIDQEITTGESVTLDGSGSDDPDGSIVSYAWSEGGEELGNSAEATLEVSGLEEGPYTFTLLVTDDEGDTDTDTVEVDVIPAPAQNQPPMADAGIDQEVISGESVTLDGRGSDDPDGSIVSYAWSEGEEVLGTSADATLEVTLAEGEHEIDLVVTDDEGAEGTDSVVVTVTAAGEPADDGIADSESSNGLDGAKTSATGELAIPLRTLA